MRMRVMGVACILGNLCRCSSVGAVSFTNCMRRSRSNLAIVDTTRRSSGCRRELNSSSGSGHNMKASACFIRSR